MEENPTVLRTLGAECWWCSRGHRSRHRCADLAGSLGESGQGRAREGADFEDHCETLHMFSNADQEGLRRTQTQVARVKQFDACGESCCTSVPLLLETTRIHAEFGIPGSQAV